VPTIAFVLRDQEGDSFNGELEDLFVPNAWHFLYDRNDFDALRTEHSDDTTIDILIRNYEQLR
jgi:hypothetical protein